MYNKVLSFLKSKKTKKEKIVILSFLSKGLLNTYYGNDIDIFRFEIDEFCKFHGYKDEKKVAVNDILASLKNLGQLNDNEKKTKFIAVDLPLYDIYEGNNYSLEKAIKFYNNANADVLVVNIDHNVLELINNLSKIKIPVIAYAKCAFQEKENNYLQEIHNKILEAERLGAVMCLIENFALPFTKNLKNSISIPIISTEKNDKLDGYYAKFSSVLGLLPKVKNKYLNLFELIRDGINDCLADFKK